MGSLQRGALALCANAIILMTSAALAGEYWQQEVNYVIEVTLEDDLRTINGTIDIDYHNNSPDTLWSVYLKAFPNAIQKGSYADLKRRSQNDYSLASIRPEQEGSLTLKDRSGVIHQYMSFSTDNTIITVELSKPLVPGGRVELSFDFTVILPRPSQMRMGVTREVTKAVYWFPQACVYDWKLGWVNSQYLGWGETYGDYGRVDFTIHAPEDQIVAATGVLVNRDEAMPPELRELLDIRRYLSPRSEWPQLNLDPSKKKTWHYIAENVNDFVWTSSNQFCIDSGMVNGVMVFSYPLRYKAARWTTAVELGMQAVETFSELYYPYQWPVVRICDAYSGMEYPMLTNCSGGGTSTGFAFLLYHEIGHFWFQGQVGSNQVDRPFMDEGFTTHMEHNIIEKYYGHEDNFSNYENWYQKRFAPPIKNRNARGFRPLLLLMKEGLDRPMMYTSYDQGKEYWPYRVPAYYKCAAMHYSLRSFLGDSLYYRAMHHYCDKWFFKHPYEDDFTQAMEEATGIELSLFLEQWYYSRHRLDYAFAGKWTRVAGRTYVHTIKLKRPGDFVSPVDVAVIWEQGDTTFYTVPPEGMEYAKPGYILLPTWNQFRRLEKEYRFAVRAARRIDKVVVDPHNLLMDINRMNNQSGFLPPIEARLDNMFFDRIPVNEYMLRYRPDVWYDEPNGVQLGFHTHGSYLGADSRFSLDFRMGTESARPMFDLELSDPFKPFGTHSKIYYRCLRADRRTLMSSGLEKRFRTWTSRPDHELIRLHMDYSKLSGDQPTRLDPLPSEVFKYLPDATWDATPIWYSRFTAGVLRTFRYGRWFAHEQEGVGMYKESANYRGFMEHRFLFGLDLTQRRRTLLKLRFEMWGTTGTPPTQYLNHLSRVRPIDVFSQSQVFRSPGTFPTQWSSGFYPANERVRGYQDRQVYFTEYIGGSVDWWSYCPIPWRKLQSIPLVGDFLSRTRRAFFLDAGYASIDDKETMYAEPVRSGETAVEGDHFEFFMSAGVSFSFPPVWGEHRVRVDFPLYLNKPQPGDNEFAFRFSVAWLLPSEF
ncbi:MAG: M1 family metallopeptidase [Candidatus Zixiibacteriota bacterium]|nr:MAG: M1 family metallopeptidase [candidate division Zixibacteria bacterium]